MMAGTVVETERCSEASLADFLLMAFTSRVYHEAEVVDDYEALLTRIREVWSRSEFTHHVFDSTHLRAAAYIAFQNCEEFSCPEEDYISALIGGWFEVDPPEYFKKGTAQ
jgi:hypothetical protein